MTNCIDQIKNNPHRVTEFQKILQKSFWLDPPLSDFSSVKLISDTPVRISGRKTNNPTSAATTGKLLPTNTSNPTTNTTTPDPWKDTNNEITTSSSSHPIDKNSKSRSRSRPKQRSKSKSRSKTPHKTDATSSAMAGVMPTPDVIDTRKAIKQIKKDKQSSITPGYTQLDDGDGNKFPPVICDYDDFKRVVLEVQNEHFRSLIDVKKAKEKVKAVCEVADQYLQEVSWKKEKPNYVLDLS
eukprot:CAMPEP_0114992954 /NCGR_PEP_ID=MMETSP0216-20121206/12244_1 /TAXON_ID=223996 /ORGANISM="Protocruzia adherens, Strain Boccale" /LENGTH=239 /DNA_ID=CAMNT_0002356509 /DNA_START=182 /DNA_END=898 /DNA_ORIENTATION=+